MWMDDKVGWKGMLVQKEGPGYGASVAREESANTMMLGAIRSKTITEIRRETPTYMSAIHIAVDSLALSPILASKK